MTSTTGTGKGTAQTHLGEHSGSLVNSPDPVKLPRVSWNLFIFQFFKQSIGLILGNNSTKTLIVPNYCTTNTIIRETVTRILSLRVFLINHGTLRYP